MKIYVITKGEYSDYHICAVTDDKEKAEILANRFSDHWDEAGIEEYDTDDCEIIIKQKNIYECGKDKETNKISISKVNYINDENVVKEYSKYFLVYVRADNEEQALKIASDQFAKYRAEKLDL